MPSTELRQRVVAKTAAYTVNASVDRSGTVFTNRGATGSVTFTLQAANSGLKGYWYEFRVHADQSLIVAAAAVNTLATVGDATADNVGFQTTGARVGRSIIAKCDGTSWFAEPLGSSDGFNVDGVLRTAAAALTSAGAVTSTSATAGVGYATGAGGAVTQATSITTGVTLNTVTGQITTVSAATAAGAEDTFTVTNSAVAATDVVPVTTTYAGAGLPLVYCSKVAAGSFNVTISNLAAVSALDAALVINFVVLKGVAA